MTPRIIRWRALVCMIPLAALALTAWVFMVAHFALTVASIIVNHAFERMEEWVRGVPR